jgi:hypothetical protein
MEEEQEEQKSNDIKIGEIELREGQVLVIKKTNYKGSDRIDFRVWLNSPTYKGPSKQGFVLTLDKIDTFMKIVDKIKDFSVKEETEMAKEAPAKRNKKK